MTIASIGGISNPAAFSSDGDDLSVTASFGAPLAGVPHSTYILCFGVDVNGLSGYTAGDASFALFGPGVAQPK